MRILAEIEFAMQATVTEIQNCWETEGVPASCRIAGRYEGYIKRLLQALIRSTTPSAVNSTMSVQLSLVPGLEESKPLPFEECNDLEDKVGPPSHQLPSSCCCCRPCCHMQLLHITAMLCCAVLCRACVLCYATLEQLHPSSLCFQHQLMVCLKSTI